MYYNYNSQQYPTYFQQNYYTPDRNVRQAQNLQQQFSTYSHDRPAPNTSVRDSAVIHDPSRFYASPVNYVEQHHKERQSEPIKKEPQFRESQTIYRGSPKLDKSIVRSPHYSINPNTTHNFQKPEAQNSVPYFPLKQSFMQLQTNSPLKHSKYEAQTKNQYLYSPVPVIKKDPSVNKIGIFSIDSPNREKMVSPPPLDLGSKNYLSPQKPHQRSQSSKNFQPPSKLRQSQYDQTQTDFVVEQQKEKSKVQFVAKSRPGESQRVPKTNQDSYSIQPNFCGHANAHLFMVLDGHGQNGHFVSDWLHKQLLTLFENHFSLFINKHFDDSVISKAFHACFTQVDALLSQTGMDVSLSGSTIVVVIMIDNKMWCGNLGDSRAILLSVKSKQLLIYELSHDHKPDNPLEEQRIKKAGGRVSPVRNQQGQGLGPMRVWAKNYQYPGLAMSRSMGDQLAHQVGVISTPEIIGHTISPQDKYMVLGSDGLFEWLSNQQVSQLALDNIDSGQTLQQTVDLLVQKATQEWLKLGDSVDDITCILVQLQ